MPTLIYPPINDFSIELLTAVLVELPPLISEADLHVAQE